MRLEQLYLFYAAAETGSIRKAGETLFLSPQSASKALLQLEEEWHTKLFLRSRTGVTLTTEGEQAYILVQRLLEDVQALENHFQISSRARHEELRPVSICSCAVMEPFAFGTVNILMEQYPNVPIQIDKKSSVQITELLFSTTQEEKLPDLILKNEMPENLVPLQKQSETNFNCYFLFEDELRLQVPQNDPLASLDYIPLSLLEDLPMLLYSGKPDIKTGSEKVLQQWGHTLKNVSRISNIETCSQIALNHHRYCFVGFPSVEFRPLAGVVYQPLERRIVTNQLLLVKKHRANRRITSAFLHSMEDYFNVQKLW